MQHEGSYTTLLHDDAALDAEIWRLTSLGLLPQDLLIVEFCDTADREGIYRKAIAYVVGDTNADDLDRLCLDEIARFKRPKDYVFVDQLPKNNYGKILKTELREADAKRG